MIRGNAEGRRMIGRLRDRIRRGRASIILLGIVFSAVYWIGDGAVRVFVFEDGEFPLDLLVPTGREFPIRVSIALLFLLLCVYAQWTVNRSRRMEDNLRESEMRYRNLIDGAMDIILVLSPEGRLITANPAFAARGGRIISIVSPAAA